MSFTWNNFSWRIVELLEIISFLTDIVNVLKNGSNSFKIFKL